MKVLVNVVGDFLCYRDGVPGLTCFSKDAMIFDSEYLANKERDKFSMKFYAVDESLIHDREQLREIVEKMASEPKADSDGWIKWEGGICPVKEGTLVDIKFRDGEVLYSKVAINGPEEGRAAQARFWKHDNHRSDIIAYRLSKPKEEGPWVITATKCSPDFPRVFLMFVDGDTKACSFKEATIYDSVSSAQLVIDDLTIPHDWCIAPLSEFIKSDSKESLPTEIDNPVTEENQPVVKENLTTEKKSPSWHEILKADADSYDPVNHPSHYTQGGIECIDALEACMTTEQFQGFLKGNVMKYLWRLEKKGNPVQDSQKAKWYMERYLDCLIEGAK